MIGFQGRLIRLMETRTDEVIRVHKQNQTASLKTCSFFILLNKIN
jgi:hypothetical protein